MDLVKLEKELIEKQSNHKNNERSILENELVQKKLKRFVEDLKRQQTKNQKRREEVQTTIGQFRREFELKKE